MCENKTENDLHIFFPMHYNSGMMVGCWSAIYPRQQWGLIECLRCAAMKTEQLWVELQRFYGAYDITEMM
jgi:hypothetical protein